MKILKLNNKTFKEIDNVLNKDSINLLLKFLIELNFISMYIKKLTNIKNK